MDECGIHGAIFADDTLIGTVGNGSSIQGNLLDQGGLIGSVDSGSSIYGELQTQGEFVGIINSGSSIQGELETLGLLIGEVGFPDCDYPDAYDGEYEATPKSYEQYLATGDKYVANDITIRKIPYYETSNESGTTVYIAGDINYG